MNGPDGTQTEPRWARWRARLEAGTLLLIVTLAILAGSDVSETPLPRAIASWSAFVAAALAAIAITPRAGKLVAAAVALYTAACVAIAFFQLGQPLGLGADFVLAAPKDSARTLVRLIGWPATIALALAAIVFTAAVAASFAVIAGAAAPAPRRRRFALAALPLLVLAVFWAGLPHILLRLPDRTGGGFQVRPAMAAVPPLAAARNEPVFIVQLESVNGVIATDPYVSRGKPMPGDPLTAMRQLARKGIFFPRFWASAVMTHKAQETILCGVVRNAHPPHFYKLVPFDAPCLPRLLSAVGYETVFLSNYSDAAFYDTDELIRHAGFRDIRFADFMKPGDPVTLWGYDEEVFFVRAFEYLRRTYPGRKKLFVHFAVSTHHYGFTRDSTDTDFRFLKGTEEERIRRYLWSQRIQDRSLLRFDRLASEFAGGNAHTFYVPDHAIPLGLYGGTAPSMGATIDNFVTPFLYVPPESRRGELAIGRSVDEMHGQGDLLPTVAELVSGVPYANSLVPFMKRERPRAFEYERCHVMTQPFRGKWLLVARGDMAYQYHVATEKLRVYRIPRNPLRQVLVDQIEDVPYAEFEARYGCRRYSFMRPVRTTSSTGTSALANR